MKLDSLAAQSRFLCQNRISTDAELKANKAAKAHEIGDLTEQRKVLRKNLRTSSPEADETKDAITALTYQLRQLQKEVRLCEAIEARSQGIADNLRLLAEEIETERKEMEDREHIRRDRRPGRAYDVEWG